MLDSLTTLESSLRSLSLSLSIYIKCIYILEWRAGYFVPVGLSVVLLVVFGFVLYWTLMYIYIYILMVRFMSLILIKII